MSLRQVKNIPDNFDQFVKEKLDKTQVDPLLANKYWQHCKLPPAKPTGITKVASYYWYGASIIVVIVILFTLIKASNTTNTRGQKIYKADKSEKISKTTTDTLFTITAKKPLENHYNNQTRLTDRNKQEDAKRTDKDVFVNNQLKQVVTDSNTYSKSVGNTGSSNQIKRSDSALINKENLMLISAKQPDIILSKIDTAHKKADGKNKAPYIIW